MGTPATSEPVSRAYAEPLCAGQLAEKMPGATIANQGFYEAPNGSVRLTYDLKVNGVDRRAACLVSHESVEFNLVRKLSNQGKNDSRNKRDSWPIAAAAGTD